jgi:hypothetical protein
MLVFFCSSLAASASDEKESSGEELDLSALLNIVIETGSFLDFDLAKTPHTISIIDARDIHTSGSRNLNELLEIYVPGFQYMINKWNGTVWGMRGVTSDRNDKIIVLINGKKQNLQSFHGFATEYDLGLLGDIDRVEVLRGPAGLVYGSGAIAGVVNIVTKTPQDSESFASAQMELNTKNAVYAHRLQGGIYTRFSNGHELSAYAGTHESDGHGENTARVYGYHEAGYIAAGERSKTTGSPWSTPGNYLTSLEYRMGNLTLYSRISRQVTSLNVYFPPEGLNIWRWAGGQRAMRRDNTMTGIDFSSPIGADRFTIDAAFWGVTNQSLQLESAEEGEKIHGTGGERRYEVTAQYLLQRITDFQAAFGVEYGRYDLGDDLQGRNFGFKTPDTEYDNIALFTEGYYDINRLISAGAGVRYDRHTETAGVMSPKASVVFTPNIRNSFQFIVQSSSNTADALAYNQPDHFTYEGGQWYGADDSVYIVDLQAGEFTDDSSEAARNKYGEVKTRLGNIEAPVERIDPEKSFSLEMAGRHSLSSHINAAGSFSYNRLSRLLLWDGSARYRTQNLGKYDALVFEGEADYENKGISAGLSGSFMVPVNFDTSMTTFRRPHIRPEFNTDREIWEPVPVPEEDSISLTSSMIRDQISHDGRFFNSLHTVTMKTFLDWRIQDYLLFHTNARVFFGLWGRRGIEESFEQQYSSIDYLGISQPFRMPMVKWNCALHFSLKNDLTLSVFAYDLLGNSDNIHGVRWHQMAAPVQSELYTVDQRTFALKLRKEF